MSTGSVPGKGKAPTRPPRSAGYHTQRPDADGLFITRRDFINEDRVARALEAAWAPHGFTLHRWAHLAPIDYWVEDRLGQARAWVEIKCRSHATSTYPTIFLNLPADHDEGER